MFCFIFGFFFVQLFFFIYGLYRYLPTFVFNCCIQIAFFLIYFFFSFHSFFSSFSRILRFSIFVTFLCSIYFTFLEIVMFQVNFSKIKVLSLTKFWRFFFFQLFGSWLVRKLQIIFLLLIPFFYITRLHIFFILSVVSFLILHIYSFISLLIFCYFPSILLFIRPHFLFLLLPFSFLHFLHYSFNSINLFSFPSPILTIHLNFSYPWNHYSAFFSLRCPS